MSSKRTSARERANALDAKALRCGCIERNNCACGECDRLYARSARLHEIADAEERGATGGGRG